MSLQSLFKFLELQNKTTSLTRTFHCYLGLMVLCYCSENKKNVSIVEQDLSNIFQ